MTYFRPEQEGWAYPTSHGKAKMHYFVEGRSLCYMHITAIVAPKKYDGFKENQLREKGYLCVTCDRRLGSSE